MEQSFADLLCDAFSETSVPSFPDGDLDFEDLNFADKFEEDKTDIFQQNLPTKEDVPLHQEATGQTAVLSSKENKDIYMAENVGKEQSDDENHEEDFESAGVMGMDITPEEDYTSSDGDSEQDGSVSGEGEEGEEEDTGTEEEPGDLLMSICCGNELCNGNKEDRIFDEGQPLAPEGAENPQVRNEEQGERESDEEVCYSERVPERGSEMTMKGDGIEVDEQEREEEKQADSSDSECEGMKIFELEADHPSRDGPAKAGLEFPEISKQSQQDLIAEFDSGEYEDKMMDFSGEEHQEAGESFADYPSDFSSCEYVEDGGKNQESKDQLNSLACTSDSRSVAMWNTCLERAVAGVTWTGRAGDTDEEGDEYLYSRDLEVDADRFRSLRVATGEKGRGEIDIVERVLGDAVLTGSDDGGETGESDSYSSSEDEVQVKGSDEDHLNSYDHIENNKQPKETQFHGGSSAAFARWSKSDDYNRTDTADFNINWNLDVLTADTHLFEDLLTTEDTDEAETPLSDVTWRPAEDVNSYSAVKRGDAKTTSPSNQGSLDDSFFFTTEIEASGTTELGQLGDDEDEEERNWEQEQERINAFFKFYDDSDGEIGREGRQIKVKFCADPLSQVIRYETDSSDRDSLSSSTDREEDLSPADTSEELRETEDTTQIKPACDPPNTQPPENVPDVSNTHICARKHKFVNMLKLILKMGVVIVMGLLMFWLVTDQVGWFNQMSFF